MTKTATLVRTNLPHAAGEQHLYRLDPPLREVTSDSMRGYHEYVVVSAVDVFGRPETYIFPADSEGEITSWGELEGSFQGGWDHEQALRNAGYTIA